MPVHQSRLICLEVVRLLRKEREGRGLSKYALANMSGVSQQMLGYMEKEMRNPTLETLLKIAYALEIDLGAFIQRAEKNIPRRPKK